MAKVSFVTNFNERVIDELKSSNSKLDNRIKDVFINGSDLIIIFKNKLEIYLYQARDIDAYFKKQYISFNDYCVIKQILLKNKKDNNYKIKAI